MRQAWVALENDPDEIIWDESDQLTGLENIIGEQVVSRA